MNEYGAKMERGRVTGINAKGAVLESIDRPGVVTPGLKRADGSVPSVGESVWFWMADDGSGLIDGGVAWADVTGKPATYPPADHTHDYVPLRYAGGTAAFAGHGTYGYCKLITIKITGTYTNNPIVFELTGRDFGDVRMMIRFHSTSSLDPGLETFVVTDHPERFAIAHSGTSTWDVYAHLNELWGNIYVNRWWSSGELAASVMFPAEPAGGFPGYALPAGRYMDSFLASLADITTGGSILTGKAASASSIREKEYNITASVSGQTVTYTIDIPGNTPLGLCVLRGHVPGTQTYFAAVWIVATMYTPPIILANPRGANIKVDQSSVSAYNKVVVMCNATPSNSVEGLTFTMFG